MRLSFLDGPPGRYVRRMAARVLRPLHPWLQRRDANLFGCRLGVTPDVFHPGLYFSTKVFAQHLLGMEVYGQRALDMGTGSGAIGILAASRGARVLALDINPAAVAMARRNADLNGVSDRFEAIESDLFSRVPVDEAFDLILFNPPFYPVAPNNMCDRARCAGEGYETLRAFYQQVARFLGPEGRAVLITSTDMDLDLLAGMAEANGLALLRETVVPHFFEKFVIREYSAPCPL